MSEPAPPRLLGWLQLVLREGAAFSLPAFRGAWFPASLGWMALAVAAHARQSPGLARARGGVALVGAALCGHAFLAAIYAHIGDDSVIGCSDCRPFEIYLCLLQFLCRW